MSYFNCAVPSYEMCLFSGTKNNPPVEEYRALVHQVLDLIEAPYFDHTDSHRTKPRQWGFPRYNASEYDTENDTQHGIEQPVDVKIAGYNINHRSDSSKLVGNNQLPSLGVVYVQSDSSNVLSAVGRGKTRLSHLRLMRQIQCMTNFCEHMQDCSQSNKRLDGYHGFLLESSRIAKEASQNEGVNAKPCQYRSFTTKDSMIEMNAHLKAPSHLV